MKKLFNCPYSGTCDNEKCLTCGLDQAAYDEFEKHKIYNTYKKNQAIFLQGNPAFGFYYVHSGKAKISTIGKEGKESILRLASPGNILGYCSLFSNEIYTASAIALEDCVVCFIDKEYFLKAIEKYPALTLNIISQLSRSIQFSDAQNVALAQKNVRERFAALLLSLKDTYGVKDGHHIRLDIKLSREEMASMIGTSMETLVRLMTEFKNEGILEQNGKVIFVISNEKLLQFANI